MERNPAPSGCTLVNAYRVGQHGVADLVSLASEIQNADVALNNQSGKITVILDQVCVNFFRLLRFCPEISKYTQKNALFL